MAPPNLSSTAREMLEAAAQHNQKLAFPPERLARYDLQGRWHCSDGSGTRPGLPAASGHRDGRNIGAWPIRRDGTV